ncbi:aminotransferase class V-fold PLP-dependent enzyme [Synergistaceae bacterium OttesenSCG-928-D05]|nr:aminotransferase class V-fold PLP-dependent enzyme [Synergistaceae bacterium OttesenSCG-928-D05]
MSIYMNNAATSWPKPEPVSQAMCNFITEHGANLSRGSASERDIESLDYVFSCRAKLAKLLGGYDRANPTYVTLANNITESLNIVIKGYLKPGMRVITTSMEHNAVIRPLRHLEKEGVRVDVIQCSIRGYMDPKVLDSLLEEPADMVVMTHCSNVCGALQDIESAAEICWKRHVPLVLDCAQTAGVVPISASELGLAALCFTGHKGLLGPQGTGGIIWEPGFARKCDAFIEGGTGSFSHEEYQPAQLPDKFESGTPNLPGITGLLAAVSWIEKEGIDKIHAREREIGERLENGLRSIKEVKVLGPSGDTPRLPVYSLNVKAKDNAFLALDLADIYRIETRPGLHCSPLAHRTLGSFPNGALRLSPGYFTKEDEVDATVEAIKELAAK